MAEAFLRLGFNETRRGIPRRFSFSFGGELVMNGGAMYSTSEGQHVSFIASVVNKPRMQEGSLTAEVAESAEES